MGKIILINSSYESPSGHIERDELVTLEEVDMDTLILRIDARAINFISGSRSETKRSFSIKTRELIDLIKKNGKEIT